MNETLASQSFLGPDSDAVLAAATIGIVGLGGGGSHVSQQSAHLGIGRFVPVDHDIIEWRNLNRLVGATANDVRRELPKVKIAERSIRGVNPDAVVTPRQCRWQEATNDLLGCDVIVGCVDLFREREELERFARRHLIPYIDLGMDVHVVDGRHCIGGQVVLSAPGGVCLRCLGIITDRRLTLEAQHYGSAGSKPQVVWTNGVLASIAVGLIAQLFTPWHDDHVISGCYEFDGNRNRVETSRMDCLKDVKCSHYRDTELGDAFFNRLAR